MTGVNNEGNPKGRPQRLAIWSIDIVIKLRAFWINEARPWLGEAWGDFRKSLPTAKTVPEAYRQQLHEVEQEFAEDLDTLTCLDTATRARIKPAITSAAISHSVRQGWVATVDDLIDDHFSLATFIVYAAVAFLAIPLFSGNFLTAPTGTCFLWTMALVIILGIALHEVWSKAGLIDIRLELLSRLVVLASLIILIYKPTFWWSLVDRWLKTPEPIRWLAKFHVKLNIDNVNLCLLDMTVIVASISLFPLAMRLAMYVLRRLSPSEPRAALACARVTIEFLEITVKLQELVEPKPTEEPPPSGEGHQEESDGERDGEDSCAPAVAKPTISKAIAEVRNAFPYTKPYIIGDERRELLARIERLACFVESPWRRVIRSGDGTADRSTDQLAAGIAAALRRWKPDIAIGGAKLHEMRKAFAVAVQNVADGEWGLLAMEASFRQSTINRLVRLARRIAAISIILGALYLVLMPPSGWRSHVDVLIPGIWISAGLLALGLDPTLSERFGLLGKVTTLLPSGK